MMTFLTTLFLFATLYFVRSELSKGFQKCPQFFLNAKPTGFPADDGKTIVDICQNMNGNLKDAYIFATKYDSSKKIPIFSAYILYSFQSSDYRPGKDIDPWFTENGLKNQAETKNYIATGYDRGHLCPNVYIIAENRDATFSLTNAVPQVPEFNQGNWKYAEQAIKDIMRYRCNGGTSYFITGAIPSNPEIKISGSVNVPSAMYTAACCNKEKQMFSFGYLGDNEIHGKVIFFKIDVLEGEINNLYKNGMNIKLFDGKCIDKNSDKKSDKYLEDLIKKYEEKKSKP